MPMILSQKNLEEMAAAVTKDFNWLFFGAEAEKQNRFALPTPIDQLASRYLGLSVSFEKLSDDGSVFGLTAYTDTEFLIEVDGRKKVLPLHQNQVILDAGFIQPGNVRKLCGKRRFTLAHECAHQILYQLEADDRKVACSRKRMPGASRSLRTQEDWNEWQANTLGAAILMPQAEVDRAMWYLNAGKPLTSYEGRFCDTDRRRMEVFTAAFGVSKSAASIRLEQLGYLIKKRSYEYHDPLEVWP